MEKLNIRFYIQIRVKLGIDVLEIQSELETALGDRAPNLRTVYRWANHFKQGSERLKDADRSGRPITSSTQHNIDLVKKIIDDNPYSTYDEIEAETQLSRGAIERIIHDSLDLKKITSRWVPHVLTERNRKSRVSICRKNLRLFSKKTWRLCDVVTGDESWFYHRKIGKKQSNKSWVAKSQKPRTVAKIGRFEPKNMFSVFFKRDGPVHISYLKRGKTIDHKAYIDDCLKPLVKTLNQRRQTLGTKNLKFHHDNARPHVHSNVIKYLKSKDFIMMDHPPYSPDLAPSDFWLFDYIKERLTTQRKLSSRNNQNSFRNSEKRVCQDLR